MMSYALMSPFARSLRMAAGMTLALIAVFSLYVYAEKQIDHANERRFLTRLLADELRQSSDDLTRMVRTYVLTGNPVYKQSYHDILAIREGKKARPVNYEGVYWDLLTPDGKVPRADSSHKIALMDQLRQADLRSDELTKLAQAKANSDKLAKIELAAIALVDSAGANPQAARVRASEMLHSLEYHQSKMDIMLPIGEFYELTNQRTLQAVHQAERNAVLLRAMFVLLGLGLLWSLRRIFKNLDATLGGPLDQLHSDIARIGKGNFGDAIHVAPGMHDSVLGWLAQTQRQLNEMEHARSASDAKLRRLTQLYAALSECNQAVVRCTNDQDLFDSICRAAVEQGGMRTAWIGSVDWQSHVIRPVASYGVGTQHLGDIHIVVDSDQPTGRGPSGIAAREDQPFWCQDYQGEAITASWHALGKELGWAASAALPLHRDGRVVGLLNVYAGEVNAFDDKVRNLLLEMASDMDYALRNFDREAARVQAEARTLESETRLMLALKGSHDALWDWDLKHHRLYYSPRWWQMLGYEPDALPVDAQLWRSMMHPQDLPGVEQLLRDFLASQGESFSTECRLKHRDGHFIPALVRGFVTRDEQGHAMRVSGTNMDLTERVRAQQMNAMRSFMLERLTSDLSLEQVLKDFALKIEDALPGTRCSISLLDEQTSAAPPAGVVCWSEPIRSGSAKVLGSVTIHQPLPAALQAHERELLEMTAHLSAIAIERKRAEKELQLVAKVFEQGSEAIIITDQRGDILRVNKAFSRITGYSEAEALGRNPSMLSSGRQDRNFYQAMWASILDHGEWKGELWNRRKDGTVYPEWIAICLLRDSSGTVTNYVSIATDVSQRKKDEENIQRLADFDPLTGLPNRRLLQDRIDTALSHAQRHNEPLALMFLDLDRFKNVNDSLGHHMGDELLIQVAQRLKSGLRDEDTVCRVGGDEFVLLCPGTDAAGAAHVATKLLESTLQRYMVIQQELAITFSIGIALYPADGATFEALSMSADTAMYRAKQDGRNAFRFFTAEMQAQSSRILQLENALRRALELQQMYLVYQPQVSLHDGRVVGMEALLRWQHPTLGAVSPAEFIPVAEDSGLILPIGEWVLRTAIQQLRTWRDAGLPLEQMAVNLSAVQFRHPNLPDLVEQVLTEVGLPAQCLELELTEGVAMDNPLGAIEVMNNLHQRGVRMSIDDFGTGYSSLNYLKRFQVYKLKIDQSFVRDIADDPDDRAIVSAIIGLARSLGFQTIAEGVETEGQLAFLRAQGCDEVQGYIYSKPLPADLFEAFVRQRP